MGAYATGPQIESYGATGGFLIRYPGATPETMAAVREYQRDLRRDCPGWLSRLEYRQETGGIVLYVFPVSEMPAMVFAGAGRSRYGKETW